jgi:hypothetical protein
LKKFTQNHQINRSDKIDFFPVNASHIVAMQLTNKEKKTVNTSFGMALGWRFSLKLAHAVSIRLGGTLVQSH